MDFYKLIRSLDELLYEVMSWLMFYPVTLWRAIIHPVKSLHYAENEMKQPEEERFAETLNPPLFLFITIALVHLVELGLVGQSDVVRDKSGYAAFVSDDETLVVMRILMFGLFPLLLARRKLKARGELINRENLRQPFYAQCYATAPFALLVSAAGIVSRLHYEALNLGVLGIAFLWFGLIEVEYYRTRLNIGRWKAFGHASLVMAQGLVVLLFVSGILA